MGLIAFVLLDGKVTTFLSFSSSQRESLTFNVKGYWSGPSTCKGYTWTVLILLHIVKLYLSSRQSFRTEQLNRRDLLLYKMVILFLMNFDTLYILESRVTEHHIQLPLVTQWQYIVIVWSLNANEHFANYYQLFLPNKFSNGILFMVLPCVV